MSHPTPLPPLEKSGNEGTVSQPVEIHTNPLGSSDAKQRESSSMQLWMHRLSVFLFVLTSAVAGVLLILLPWTSQWTDNTLLLSYPGLRMIVSSGFFRGVCSGLGVLDIWIGFWEALHYHERS
jgi:Flp pilus assembly protein protease CpaA